MKVCMIWNIQKAESIFGINYLKYECILNS